MESIWGIVSVYVEVFIKLLGYGNGSDDGIKFGFYYGCYLVYSDLFFDSFIFYKCIVWYLYESLEWNDGTLPDLYEVGKDVNGGYWRSTGTSVEILVMGYAVMFMADLLVVMVEKLG